MGSIIILISMKNTPIIVAVVVIGVVVIGIFVLNGNSGPPAQPSGSDIAAQQNSPPPPAVQPESPPTAPQANQPTQNMKHLITLKTTLGTIQFETYDADAPLAVNNFITLAQKGFYNNVIFHRVIKGFMIQGGDPTGSGMGGPGYTFADELNPATPSYQGGYVRGVVAMANAGPNTNGSQFFIMLADNPLPHSYTIFGKVTQGQDVVDKIGNLQTGANDRPVNPPAIQSVTVEEVK